MLNLNSRIFLSPSHKQRCSRNITAFLLHAQSYWLNVIPQNVKIAYCNRYITYSNKTNTSMFAMLNPAKWASFYLSSIIETGANMNSVIFI